MGRRAFGMNISLDQEKVILFISLIQGRWGMDLVFFLDIIHSLNIIWDFKTLSVLLLSL